MEGMDGWMEVLALHYILHIAWPHLFLVVTLASTSYDMLTIYKASYHKSEVLARIREGGSQAIYGGCKNTLWPF